MNIDDIAPDYVGAKRLKLALSDLSQVPRVGDVVILTVDYASAEPEGVVVPLAYTVTQPDGSKLERRVYARRPPPRVDFVPETSGTHLVRIGEVHHNRWWGSLQVTVIGDDAEA
jgi:hypothetical protein